jgi:hypothetical protein
MWVAGAQGGGRGGAGSLDPSCVLVLLGFLLMYLAPTDLDGVFDFVLL